MAIKVVMADPDITFAIGVKKALEQTGDYLILAFGTGNAAFEYLRTHPVEAVLVDFSLEDMRPQALISAIRNLYPDLSIVVSAPREQAPLASKLTVQATISKPYFARQLDPVLLGAIRAAPLPNTTPLDTVPPRPAPVPNLREAGTKIPPQPPTPAGTPSLSPDFDAAIKSLPALIDEPPISPDDTFKRRLAAMLPDKPSTPSGLRKVLESVDLSGEATIADVVNGKPLIDPPSTPTESAPTPQSTITEAALDALDTIPLRDFTLDKFAAQVEQQSGQMLPEWVRAIPEDDQATLVEPAFVGKALQSLPPPSTSSEVSQLAATLMQLSMGSAARATLLTRGSDVIAVAGELNTTEAMGIAALIDKSWKDGSDAPGSTLVRFVTIPSFGDFLLFSANSFEGMYLSMLFPAETTLKTIRRQAKQLLDALDNRPADEQKQWREAPPLSPKDTLLSRPTGLHPPPGLREAISALPAPTPTSPVDSGDLVPVAPSAAGPLVDYGVLLLPSGNAFKPDQTQMVGLWLTDAALDQGFQVEEVVTQPTHLTYLLKIPATDAPNQATKRLMEEIATRANDPGLWAEGYYIATPGRPVTPTEISEFMRFQRLLQTR